MTAVALIVEYQTPDLLELCLASLKRFAPEVRPLVVEGSEGADAHAAGVESVRKRCSLGTYKDADIVILLDTDVVILSDHWFPWIERSLEQVNAIGGLRHRGDVTQLYCMGNLLIHAHCLAMTRDLFNSVPSFRAEGSWDTAWQVTHWGGLSFSIPPTTPSPGNFHSSIP